MYLFTKRDWKEKQLTSLTHVWTSSWVAGSWSLAFNASNFSRIVGPAVSRIKSAPPVIFSWTPSMNESHQSAETEVAESNKAAEKRTMKRIFIDTRLKKYCESDSKWNKVLVVTKGIGYVTRISFYVNPTGFFQLKNKKLLHFLRLNGHNERGDLKMGQDRISLSSHHRYLPFCNRSDLISCLQIKVKQRSIAIWARFFCSKKGQKARKERCRTSICQFYHKGKENAGLRGHVNKRQNYLEWDICKASLNSILALHKKASNWK